ncbi:MAG: filamentous hemagglutinin N-terminal domain-containing protein, partial [Nitrospirota bacterium]|nr:filamentous hemagglutinin N-terminal domain-containing protein [Nitrospirota bacterium]
LNRFHSFGDFNVPSNNIANFFNNSGLATSNILGRVTGGNISNIFGTIQTTGFGNANLFLMNPAGFLFGPTATVNVGGMVTFTSANYLRLANSVRFNAIPNASADALLSAAPVAAFGFLGSNPGAITVQGSHLSVAEGTGISLVGGNITVQGGTLTAPSGQINLVSVGKPSHPNVGGEVVIAGSGQGAGFTPAGFATLGAITLSQGSTLDTSGIAGRGHAAGAVLIRGGQLVMDDSSIRAVPAGNAGISQINGNIEVTAKQVALSNGSTVTTSTPTGPNHFTGSPGNITFNVNTFSATNSTISASVFDSSAPSGAVTIQGLQGSGTSAHSVSLTNTSVSTSDGGLPSFPGALNTDGGPILIRADNIALNQSSLNALSFESTGGAITLLGRNLIDSHNSFLSSTSFFGSGGSIDFRAGNGIELTGTNIRANSSTGINGGNIAMSAPSISLSGSTLDATSGGSGHGGTISLTGTKAVSLTNGTHLTADNTLNPPFPIPPSLTPNGGTIQINGGRLFTSQQSTISAQSSQGNGGTIHIDANKVRLTDTQVTTSVSGGPQTVGGSITVDAKNVTLKNSEILSTATEGHGGTIGITTHKLHSTNSVIDATSQSGTDGTVTIERP